jgi:hypothetical protein
MPEDLYAALYSAKHPGLSLEAGQIDRLLAQNWPTTFLNKIVFVFFFFLDTD